MTTRSRLAFVLVMLGYIGLHTSCAPKSGPAAEDRAPPEEQKAEAGSEADASCPECAKRDTGLSADATDFEDSIPALSTAWLPPDQRRRIQNLDILFKDQDGRSGVLSELVNQPALITFFYTRCQNSGKCSAAISRLAALQRYVAQSGIDNKVRLLAITYEPQFDTPERISRYGLERGLRFNEQVRAIRLDPDRHQRLVDELEAPVNYNAGWVNTHGVELNLIDSRRRLVRKYGTMLWGNDQVVDDLKRALKES